MIYHVRETGAIVDFSTLQSLFPNTYISPSANVAYLNALGVDQVLEIAPPQVDASTTGVIQAGAAPRENGDWVVVWKTIPLDAAVVSRNLTIAKSTQLSVIDRDVDVIYQEAIGNRGLEYLMAEQDASAFKAAGYAGNVPPTVQTWATATGQTAQWACDSILTQATAWRDAMMLIRTSRLSSKQNVQSATTVATVREISTNWDNLVNQIRTQVGLPIRNLEPQLL